MGVYYADGGKWAFNHVVTYSRIWDEEKGEYWEGLFLPLYSPPSWDHEIKMFAGWLSLGSWDFDLWGVYDNSHKLYKRVDE